MRANFLKLKHLQGAAVFVLLGLTQARADGPKESKGSLSSKQYEAFILEKDAFLYRRPLLASPPAEGLDGALKKGTELLILYVSQNKEWAFVKSRDDKSGWVPNSWIASKYFINPVEIRSGFFSKQEEISDPTYQWQHDIKVWGDDLLLQAYEDQK